MSKITNDRLHPVWHRMLYTCSCINMATVGVKGLISDSTVSLGTEVDSGLLGFICFRQQRLTSASQ